MIKIISFKICPFVQRVTALLEAKDIPYQLEFIQLSDKPQWFLDLSPTGQVPVLVTESGEALFESDAIIEYLDEIAAPLQPELTPVQKARNRAWSYQASKHYLVQCSTMRSGDQETLQQRLDKLSKAFAKAEQALAQRPTNSRFFSGNKLTNVDIAWLVLLHRADIIRRHTGFDMLDGFPQLQAWQVELMNTGLAEDSVSSDFEQTFAEFYLSEKTFLGQLTQPETEQSACTPDGNNNSNACASGSCC